MRQKTIVKAKKVIENLLKGLMFGMLVLYVFYLFVQ